MNGLAPDPDNLGTSHDAFYAALMQAHAGLSEAESHALNARLVLMMANRIGDIAALEALLRSARARTGRGLGDPA